MAELRQNNATKEWVIISTERAKRPEEFTDTEPRKPLPAHSEKCPFCLGNEAQTPEEVLAYRAPGTKANTPGWWVRVIPNKFAALSPAGELRRMEELNFFRSIGGFGAHEVIIECPDHDKSIASMADKTVEEIFLAYRDRYLAFCADSRLKLVIIFKNHGPRAGTSLEHPHSQLIAAPVVPAHIRHRLDEAMRYFDDTGECVYCVMLREEVIEKKRIVHDSPNFIAFMPFASRTPFETWVLPRAHNSSFGSITFDHAKEFAGVTKTILAKLYKGLNNPDYNYVIHSTPCHDLNEEYYHWHLQILPRITTPAGFELGSGIYINTVIPEAAAEFLRGVKV